MTTSSRHHRGLRRQALDDRQPPSRPQREHLAAASDGRFLYAVGGRDLSPAKNSPALERFDPAADSWERLPDMPTARGGLGATIAGGRLFAIGGETATDVMGKVESFDIGAKSWSSAPSMRTPRHGITATAIGRTVYALGGATRPGPRDRGGDGRGAQPRGGPAATRRLHLARPAPDADRTPEHAERRGGRDDLGPGRPRARRQGLVQGRGL